MIPAGHSERKGLTVVAFIESELFVLKLLRRSRYLCLGLSYLVLQFIQKPFRFGYLCRGNRRIQLGGGQIRLGLLNSSLLLCEKILENLECLVLFVFIKQFQRVRCLCR